MKSIRMYLLLFVALFLPLLLFAENNVKESPVSIEVNGGVLNGKLVIPETLQPCPVVLIIAGSGPTDMNGNNALIPAPINNYKMLADSLAAHGIASLRYDKRGIATSGGFNMKEEELRFEDYINDAKACVNFLSTYESHSFSSVYVLGHSEGALIGAVVTRDMEISGFISIAGMGRSMAELLDEQLSNKPELIKKSAKEINDKLKVGELVKDVPEYLMSIFRPSVQPYLISCYQYKPQSIYASIKQPILILQGDNDIQVSTRDALGLKMSNLSANMVILPKMTHLMKDCEQTDIKSQNMFYMSCTAQGLNGTLVQEIINFIRK